MNSKLTVSIHQTAMTIKEYRGQRVVTLKDIDMVHQRPEGTARKRFNDNKEHFIEGVDYFKISPSEFRTAIGEMDSRQNTDVTLVTEPGYLMVVKSFTDDLAWQVQRELVNSYFRANAMNTPSRTPKLVLQERRLQIMEMNAKSRLAKQMMQLWSAAGVKPQDQALALNGYYEGLELPRSVFVESTTAMLDKTTIAKHLGLYSRSGAPHAHAVGAIIGKLELTDEEQTLTPYSRNGHDDVAPQYTESVERKVACWLEENHYPAKIAGDGKNYTVEYRR